MKIIVKKNYEEISKEAASIIGGIVKENPVAVLGLATGSTPIGTYKELIRMHKEEGLDFSKIRSFNLDEYIGLSGDNPNSYRYFMNDQLFNHININKENTKVPDGKAVDFDKYCREYDEMIESSGGIDIQILGIGSNGHIAFNEPDHVLSVGTTTVDLTQETINDNARFFEKMEDVPKKSITMGIGSIMKAKKIILLASGKNKRDAIKKILENKITTMLPASLLLLHPDVTIIVDEEAYGE